MFAIIEINLRNKKTCLETDDPRFLGISEKCSGLTM